MADSGNMFVRNQGLNPAVNFNFMLRVEGIIDVPCRSVHAFQRENEYEYIQEGGLNDYVHMRRKPISKPFTFQIERYVGVDATDPLANGTELILPVILYVNRNTVYGKGKGEIGAFAPVRMYVFTGCTVMGKEYGGLDAEKSGLLMETTTIAYREMVCMENMATTSQDAGAMWEFPEDKRDFLGSGTRSARQNPQKELRKDELKADIRGKRWMFRDGNTEKSYIKEELVETVTDEKGNIRAKSSDLDFRGLQRAAVSKLQKHEKRKADMASKAASQRWMFRGGNTEKQYLSNEMLEVIKNEDGTRTVKSADPAFRGLQRAADSPLQSGEKRKDELEKAGSKWEFQGDDYNGKGKRSAEHPPQEKRKTAFEREAERNQWQFDKKSGSINGLGRQSAVHPEGEIRKRKMEKSGQKWPDVQSAEDVNNYLKDTEKNPARKWPDERSAKDVNDYLKDTKKNPARKWEFDGTGEQSAKLPDGELRRSEMELLARDHRWSFDRVSGSMDGAGELSANQVPDELRRSEMEQRGFRWPGTRSAVDVADYLASGKRGR